MCSLLAGLLLLASQPRLLPMAHSHNDYAQRAPLASALQHRFGSIEADVFLVGGKLLVAHDLADVDANRTLASMYLEPLLERVGKNGGKVYGDPLEVILLVDVKADGGGVYRALTDALRPYREFLSHLRDGSVHARAVKIVLSGDRPIPLLESEARRWAFVDGRLPDLVTNRYPASLMPIVSDNWRANFRWMGEGEIPQDERAKLRRFVRLAHAQGRKLRFWATPENPALWAELLDAGVDLIGTDDHPRLAEFLRSRG